MRETFHNCQLSRFTDEVVRDAVDLEIPVGVQESESTFLNFLDAREKIPRLVQHLIFVWAGENSVTANKGTVLTCNAADLGFERAMHEIADLYQNPGRAIKLMYWMEKNEANVPTRITIRYPGRRKLQRKEFRIAAVTAQVKLTVDANTNEESYSIIPPIPSHPGRLYL